MSTPHIIAAVVTLAIIGYGTAWGMLHVFREAAAVCRRRRPCVVRGEPKPVLYGSKA